MFESDGPLILLDNRSPDERLSSKISGPSDSNTCKPEWYGYPSGLHVFESDGPLILLDNRSPDERLS
ncbi:hypothetical protein PSY30_23760, partial [Shigella flexneri]|nr:hypothetical protein [Shigella flexneri]